MFDWDIEARACDVDEFTFRAVKVPAGTGRFHTRGQASKCASLANEREYDEDASKAWNNTIRAVERNRNGFVSRAVRQHISRYKYPLRRKR